MAIGHLNLMILAEWDWTSPELPIDSWWFFTVVLVLLVLFIWAIARLTTRTTDDIDPTEIDRQMLSAVSELRSQGELSQEEFRSIKGRLVERLAADTTSDNTPEATLPREPPQRSLTQPEDTQSSDEEVPSESEHPPNKNKEDNNS